MSRVEPESVTTVGIVGCGVIGGGWALHFLAQGLHVLACDPHPRAAERFAAMAEAAWPQLVRLGLKPGASLDNIQFLGRVEEVASRSDVIQESTPESLESKVAMLARIDAAASPDAPILSSTSGLRMTDMQVGCRHPDRTAVGHPWNPPYLIPLVEVVGGELSDPAVVEWAARFYAAFGKKVVKMDREVPGFIATRLQEALWREMLHMIDAGEATPEQIDDAVRFGPGLRWAILGPSMVYHLAGGEGGMAYVLEQFGPSLKWPWTRLEAPELTERLSRLLVEGCDRMAAGRSLAEMTADRDHYLVELLALLSRDRAGKEPS